MGGETVVNKIEVATNYYQHFDADFELEIPGEGFGGWKKRPLPIDLDTTAVVVMHAWDTGSREQYPGWHRVVEYMTRAGEIGAAVFPRLLGSIRQAGVRLIHVVSPGDDYYRHYLGYRTTLQLAGEEPEEVERMKPDPVMKQLQAFRHRHVFPGAHNEADIRSGFSRISFLESCEPQGEESIAATSHQLFALCRQAGITHLIYTGFAINWCLLLSPGGMADMSKHGIMCSAIRQAVTAVENRETARLQSNKEEALWRVGLAFGFVYDADDWIAALECRNLSGGKTDG